MKTKYDLSERKKVIFFNGEWYIAKLVRKKIKRRGYWMIFIPQHPNAKKYGNDWGFIFEHRVVAERKVGRYLTKNDVVHHKNGTKTDNRVENLEIMTPGKHSKVYRNSGTPLPLSIKTCPSGVSLRYTPVRLPYRAQAQ